MSNQLKESKSPYLLQHSENPVDWRPWSDDIFEEAERDNKMILVSIGYAACHWCHVMERESFTNTEIAELMNKHFIPVKVDREERPDVDQIYMNAVQLINGQGGWPLTCFAMPDGSPFFGGTYYPPREFQGILQSLAATWLKERYRIEDAAKQVKDGLVKTDIVKPSYGEKEKLDAGFLHQYVEGWQYQFDSSWGGDSGAPKFPLPAALKFLLDYAREFNQKEVMEHVRLSLERMAQGGIYDHVGGGFARYATDTKWRIPHFEKMLYDNGQLLGLYSDFYRLEPHAEFESVIRDTADSLIDEFQDDNGGFYSSYDADSEGEEGKYYVWTKDEIEKILGEDAAFFSKYFNISERGNWENGKNILYHEKPLAAVCQDFNLTEKQGRHVLRRSLQRLKQERAKRIKPGLDNKKLVSWNAMAIEGLLKAYHALGESRWREQALKAAYFLKKQAMDKTQLFRNCRTDEHAIPGFLEDYAFAVRAFTYLYMTTADENWLNTARGLLNYTLEHFRDESSGLFFQTEKINAPLGMQKMEIMDNVIPAANSVMAQNLYRFSVLDEKPEWKEQAVQMLHNMKPKIQHKGPFFANWMQLWQWFVNPPREIAVAGPKAGEKFNELLKNYLPAIAWVWSEKDSDLPLLKNRHRKDKTLIYICRNNTCQQPVEAVDEALKRVR